VQILKRTYALVLTLTLLSSNCALNRLDAAEKDEVMHVFFLAGQSNMVGADARSDLIDEFPPFVGAGKPREDVLFSYDTKRDKSNGWAALQPVRGSFGSEITFARKIKKHMKGPVAIVKCAVGGTTIAENWNPDGGELYRTAMNLIKSSLADLRRKGIKYKLEAVLWHQGENDMPTASSGAYTDKDYLISSRKSERKWMTQSSDSLSARSATRESGAWTTALIL